MRIGLVLLVMMCGGAARADVGGLHWDMTPDEAKVAMMSAKLVSAEVNKRDPAILDQAYEGEFIGVASKYIGLTFLNNKLAMISVFMAGPDVRAAVYRYDDLVKAASRVLGQPSSADIVTAADRKQGGSLLDRLVERGDRTFAAQWKPKSGDNAFVVVQIGNPDSEGHRALTPILAIVGAPYTKRFGRKP